VTALLLAAMLVPLALALVQGWRAGAWAVERLAPWAPLPALVLALVAPAGTIFEAPWLLLGSRFGVDDTGRVFLLLTALMWLLAGWFARGYMAGDAARTRFRGFFLVTQAGNLALCLSLDAGSFYLAFAIMTFAAYGLIVHSGSGEARRAGAVYLVMAVLGEGALLAGILLLTQLGATTWDFATLATGQIGGVAAALLIAGFGIKVGLPLLHLWLPLAHPVAPVPASAVLSGVMLKAGVLGWLRFLPLGVEALPAAGSVLMIAGLVGMFFGVVAGLAQRDPKVLLAYSSISQMGFLALGVGAGLVLPAAWPLLWPAVALYALHHALAKSALFLGVGAVDRHGANRATLALLALPALALAGAPLTSGMLAKLALKGGVVDLPAPWPVVVDSLLPVAAIGTALLMLRLFALLAHRQPSGGSVTGLLFPWGLLVAAGAVLPWWQATISDKVLKPAVLGDAAWPVLVAMLVAAAARRWRGRWPAIPPGDLVVFPERAVAWWRARGPRGGALRIGWPRGRGQAENLRGVERKLARWGTASALWLVLLVAGIINLLR